ncbi:uncharacterized protein ACWYII_025288 isoform 1-T1 [Salvelinus alpinus]
MAFNNMVGPRGRNDALAVTQPNTRLFTGSHVNPIGDVGLKRSRGNPPPNPEKPSPGWDLKDVPDPLPNVVLHLALQTLNAASCLVFNRPKFSHVTLLLCTLHWFPVEARIHYKTMVFAYGAARGNSPPYHQATLKPYTPNRVLCSGSSGLLALTPLRESSSCSAQPSQRSSLPWHPNGGTSFPMKQGQQSPCPSFENI